MATAVSKPASQPPKMKRPPPFVQTGVNGVKPSQPSASPSSASKRLPGAGQPLSSSSAGGSAVNGTNNRPIQRPKKEMPKPNEPASRLQRPSTRTSVAEADRRISKKFPEPYVKTTSYILKKYSKCPPSLIIHLHPTHFRFDQQDGSFPYNSEMKVIIEHIRAGTVPHDMLEELLRAGVRFYEGCLIVRVVDHKSVSAQKSKASVTSTDENNSPFSIHNYNQHVTPSAYVPYPKQNQTIPEKPDGRSSGASGSGTDTKTTDDSAASGKQSESNDKTPEKQPSQKPRVFTTVLHPTPRSLYAELTLLSTTPDPRAVNKKPAAPNGASRTPSTSGPQPSSISTNATDRGPPAKRQKMLVEPHELHECESKLVRALAPPLFLDPVDSLEATRDLLRFLESPLHRDSPPSPKTRKRTVAELAADEALAAEEERFMLIMDERLEPTVSAATGAAKTAAVDDAGGVAPFEPRFSRFKTLENIRLQHEEKAKREHERKLQQDHIKRQQQEQERERRRAMEQRQAEEHAKEEARRQQLAAQQAQAQLAAQQNRHPIAQANGMGQVSQGPQSSPVVRNQTPHNTSSPLVGSSMGTQAGVPMTMTASAQGAGSPPRPPSALQHAHPGVMAHPMAASRSQQGQSRNGTPQMSHGTPSMPQATPVMRNVTPTQRMSHGSPNASSMAPTPVMGHAMMGTPQMGNGMGLTPQQQLLLQQRQQQLLAQQGLGHGQFTPQQIAQMQANMHAQQNIQSHQQHMMQPHQAQPNQHHQQQQQHNASMQKLQSQQAYQAQLMRAQLVQMQMAQQQNHGQQQHHQGSPPQMTPQQQQQQQMLLNAAQANGGHLPQNFQGMAMNQRYQQLYQQRLLRLRQEMAQRYMPEYGPPTQYPPQIAQQYGPGLERSARTWVHELMRRERESAQQQQQRASQVAAVQAQAMQQQQQNMMHGGMGK
ncbi:hypothetical protein ANI_1_2982014 [Paecilomyces variotii No. 5]|uniref:Spt20-like SEP domain-containing protein n=1 Tax=Byssochlamys spectabilis (strain No. 5 / NBRC 109023) TaxID=1356009 RepID=V5G9U5_BYSSN|nr:hypothetical protein ANI_1_2982014 [Paecilomyces variotii No. 5]